MWAKVIMSQSDELISKNGDDALVFADDVLAGDNAEVNENLAVKKHAAADDKWKVLVVDDDEIIHAVTKMVLADYQFEGRGLNMISAYSAKEAIEVLEKEEDVALILLDIIMETDDAGLRCAKQIREDLQNHNVRIIMRTGQPGQAPEHEVIVNYDINDYKAKTELTAQKLFTVVTSSLRSYKQIKSIEQNKRGLENIISASRNIFELNTFHVFAEGILKQLGTVLNIDQDFVYAKSSGFTAYQGDERQKYNIVASTGEFTGKENKPLEDVIQQPILEKLHDALDRKENIFTESTFTGYFESQREEHSLLYFQSQTPFTDIDRDLISIFATNVAIAFENLSLNNEIKDTQKELIYTLSEVVEGYSRETAVHINRVGAVSTLIGEKLGMSEQELEVLAIAAPMHDIGKIGTPDSILKKPGKLTDEEYEVMKKHAEYGWGIFKNSKREMMTAAGIIAHEHHEKWDGTGYPQGLKGDGIHIYGRIVALADVIDALISRRCYKEPWAFEDVIELIKSESGKHFDPKVVDAFLESIPEYMEILEQLPIES